MNQSRNTPHTAPYHLGQISPQLIKKYQNIGETNAPQPPAPAHNHAPRRHWLEQPVWLVLWRLSERMFSIMVILIVAMLMVSCMV